MAAVARAISVALPTGIPPIWASNSKNAYSLFTSPKFTLPSDGSATLYITARQTQIHQPVPNNGNTDSKLHASYKLFANGQLVTMGPGRNVPPTSQAVDAVDLTPFIVADGSTPNLLYVTCYWGATSGIPSESPRLWAYVNVTSPSNPAGSIVVPTGASWQAADATAFYNPGADQERAAGEWYQFPEENLITSAAPPPDGPQWASAVPQPDFPLPLAVKDAAAPVAYYRAPCSVKCVKTAPGGGKCASFVVDYGQQIMGGYALSINASGVGGTELLLQQGEALNSDGSVMCPSESKVNYTTTVTLSSSPAQNVLLMAHEWKQYRWMQVSGWPTPTGLPDSDADVAAWAVSYPVAGLTLDDAHAVPVPVVGTPWDLTCGFNASELASVGHPLASAAQKWQLEKASRAATTTDIDENEGGAPSPYAFMGQFVSSDPSLNAVWALTARSMAATALDVNVDSQTRQRDLCHVDALITAEGQYGIIARGQAWNASSSISSLSSSAPSGFVVDRGTAYMMRSATYASVNQSDPWQTWTEFRLSAAMLAILHARETGDLSLAASIYDAATERTASNLTLQFFAQVRYYNNASGMLDYTVCGGTWLCDPLVDWPTQTRDGFVFTNNHQDAVRNGFGALVLDGLSWVAGQLGHGDDAARYAAMAASIRQGMFSKLLLRDGAAGTAFFSDGVGISHAAIHSTLYAVAGGALEAEPDVSVRVTTAQAIVKYLRSRGMGAASCMTAKWVLQALYTLGAYTPDAPAFAAELLTSPGYPGWLYMIEIGATVTTEAWRPADKWNMVG